MAKSNINDVELIQACLEGNSNAFEGLVAKYQPLICAITYSATGDVGKSEELAQETFIKAWKDLGKLREFTKFKAWLCSIARTTIYTHFRREKKNVINKAMPIEHAESSHVEADASENISSTEQQKVVAQAILQLHESYREPLILFYRHHQSTREIADQLEISEENARTRLSRGRKMLKNQVVKMIENTLSETAPGKAFTAGVMASVAGLAFKGAGTAAASINSKSGIATTSGAGNVSGITSVFTGFTAKIIAVAAVAAIIVGGAIFIKHSNSPAITEEMPVAAADLPGGIIGNQPVDNAGVENDMNDSNAETQVMKSDETESNDLIPVTTNLIDPVAGKTSRISEVQKGTHFIDPNTLTDYYLKHIYHSNDRSATQMEYWFQKPDSWRYSKGGITVSNGKQMLVLNDQEKTAHISNVNASKPGVHELLMLAINRAVYFIVRGKQLPKEIEKFAGEFAYATGPIEYELLKEESNQDILMYLVMIPRKDKNLDISLEIDAKTGLVKRAIVPNFGRGFFEFMLDYSKISDELFSMEVPEGYKELKDDLPPSFQGWIFDKDLQPVSNAEIYLFDSSRNPAKGKSNSKGEFNFKIPVGNSGDRPLRYPIFVRAVSDKYPDQVAWTVIQSPESKKDLPAFVPSPGEVITEDKKGECHSIQNVTLVLESAATVSGRVLDASNNKPIKTAVVTLSAYYDDLFNAIADASRRGDFQVKTDSNGFYIFESVPTFLLPDIFTDNEANAIVANDNVRMSVSVCKDGYVCETEGFEIKTTDGLSDRELDISIVPANVTNWAGYGPAWRTRCGLPNIRFLYGQK